MSDERCTNCGEPAADAFELLIRSRNHEEVLLCDPCHDAIQAEIAE